MYVAFSRPFGRAVPVFSLKLLTIFRGLNSSRHYVPRDHVSEGDALCFLAYHATSGWIRKITE